MAQIERGEQAATESVGVDGVDVAAIEGAKRAEPPAEPALQLASLADEAPQGDGWIHEIKYDGYRVLAHVEGGQVRLHTRKGHDWTDRFPEIAAALARLPVRLARLDGEIVALRAGGVSSFAELQQALASGDTARLRFQVFDMLHLDDHDLRGVAQLARKEVLERLVAHAGSALGGLVRYADHVVGQGPSFLEQVCRMGLEGMISKRADAPYRAGRGTRWRKVKCTRREPFVVGGFTAPKGSRTGFGALLLGAFEGEALRYVGRVGTGFGERALRELSERLEALARPTSPSATDVPDARGATWTAPELVAEVAFAERTQSGVLRRSTFNGLREDTRAVDVAWTADGPGGEKSGGGAAGQGSTGGGGPRGGSPGRKTARLRQGEAIVAGVRLTNPYRVLYPHWGLTLLLDLSVASSC